MASARYTILTPPGVAQAVYQYLNDGPIKTEAINIINGYPNDYIVAWAEEMPEVDSHMKQLGTYIAEAANVETVTVVREGKSGANTWTLKNKDYQPHTVHEDLVRDDNESVVQDPFENRSDLRPVESPIPASGSGDSDSIPTSVEPSVSDPGVAIDHGDQFDSGSMNKF